MTASSGDYILQSETDTCINRVDEDLILVHNNGRTWGLSLEAAFAIRDGLDAVLTGKALRARSIEYARADEERAEQRRKLLAAEPAPTPSRNLPPRLDQL
jgi:hypothetical protein